LLELEDKAEFAERYLARLEANGIDVFLHPFIEIRRATTVVGLCFSASSPSASSATGTCSPAGSRSRTGQQVPELATTDDARSLADRHAAHASKTGSYLEPIVASGSGPVDVPELEGDEQHLQSAE
jgi:hypothetical protein